MFRSLYFRRFLTESYFTYQLDVERFCKWTCKIPC